MSSSHAILNTLSIVRQMTLSKLESIPEELYDVQPVPFNNTIRWNAGHIASTLNSLTFTRTGGTSQLPQEFTDMFKGGTKPSDWTTTPPSKAELLELLKSQLPVVTEYCQSRIDEPLATPVQLRVFELKTPGDVLGFGILHESQHFAVINNLLKVINHQQG